MARRVAYIDVDDTLVRWAGAKPIPIPNVIARVRQLHAEGALLFCWSSAGAEAARQVVTGLGIAELFEAFLPKPQLLIDDQTPSEWRGLEVIHPLSCDPPDLTPEVDHSDDDLIAASLARSPHERLQYLADLVAFEERAHRARRLE